MLLLAAGRIMDGASVHKYIFVDIKNVVYMVSPSFVFSEGFANNAVILNCDITKNTANSKGSISGVNGFEISKNTIQKDKIDSYSKIFELVNKDFLRYVHEFELKKVAKDRKSIRFCDTIILGNTSGLKIGDNCQVIGCNNTQQSIDSYSTERRPIISSKVASEEHKCTNVNKSNEIHSSDSEVTSEKRKPSSIIRGNKMRGHNNCIMSGDSDEGYSVVIEDERGNKIMANNEINNNSGLATGLKGIFNRFKKK